MVSKYIPALAWWIMGRTTPVSRSAVAPRLRTAVNTPMDNRPSAPATGLRVPAGRPEARSDRTLARSLRRAGFAPAGRQDMPTTFNSCI